MVLMWRAAGAVLTLLFLGMAVPMTAHAQTAGDIAALNQKAGLLVDDGKLEEAEPIALKALSMAERVLGGEHPETLASVNNLAALYYGQRRYGEAERLYRRAMEAGERVLGPDAPLTVLAVFNLAAIHQQQGRYAGAEPLFKRAVESDERVLGKEHITTLIAVNALALLYQAQGRYAEAEPLHRSVLETSERVLGPQHPETLTFLNNLGHLLQNQGRPAEAEPLYRRALETRERVLGPEHPDTLMSVHNLASLYADQGRYAEAELLYRRALDAKERVLGKDHPDTLLSMNNLAQACNAQGRPAEAERLYRQVLDARERALGPDHPDTLMSVNNLAQVYDAQGRYAEAEPLSRRALKTSERILGKEHPDTLTRLSNLASLLTNRARYAEAEPLSRRALEARVHVLGKEHPDTLTSINNLAQLYQAQGRYAEAGKLLLQALEARERVSGPEHPQTLNAASNLAGLYRAQGRYTEAGPLYRRALEASERTLGKEHPDTLRYINNLAMLYRDLGRYGEAEPLFRRAAETSERALGKEHPQTLVSAGNLAGLYQDQGDYAKAETLYRHVLEAKERILGADSPETLGSANNLASLYLAQGQDAEAESLFRRVLEGYERVLGKEHPVTLQAAQNLGGVYQQQGRLAEAEPLYRRALEARVRVLGDEHPDTLLSINNMAFLLAALGRNAEAEVYLCRALAAAGRVFGDEHPNMLVFVLNLARLHDIQGRYAKAEPLYRRALEISERTLGKEHPQTLTGMHNLAALYDNQGRYGEAETLYRRVIENRERVLGYEHPDTLASVNNLAMLHFEQGHWDQAAGLFRRSTAGFAARTLRGARTGSLTGRKKGEAELLGWQFPALVKAIYRIAAGGRMTEDDAARETFLAAQWALSSETAQSLAQMAARTAKGDGALAALVRERQDLTEEWRKLEVLQAAALGREPAKRDAATESGISTRLEGAGKRIAEIDKQLSTSFPDYAALASPAPVSVEEVQAQLDAGEALVLFLDTQEMKPAPEETFVWIVTKTGVRWMRSGLGTAALTQSVQALRCGLDASAWNGPRCAALTGQKSGAQDALVGKLLPFDLARAHQLYKELFGGAGELIQGKDLLIVPSGPLTQLPFHVLVTVLPDDASSGERLHEVALLGASLRDVTPDERRSLRLPTGRGVKLVNIQPNSAAGAAGLRPDDVLMSIGGEDAVSTPKTVEAVRARAPGSKLELRVLRAGEELTVTATLGRTTIREWLPRLLAPGGGKDTAWLARSHATSILPAVQSLAALRRVARPSAAPKPMIGFGNPLLDGPQEALRPGNEFEKRAKLARSLQHCQPVMQRAADLRDTRGGVVPLQTRGGLAAFADISRQVPLPETAGELCAVAQDLKADAGEIRLGARATESEVKSLSASGQLSQYRVVHFATHGALAGELLGSSEPGLILTPPQHATAGDDGYLSASEIAELKLDADWVILSACNTAAGDAASAQALSGLARAFMYAQARALLVSHWAVDSDATVKLITGAMREMAGNSRAGRAEALRRSMLALVAGGGREEHPAFWAPFIVAGEGGRR